MTRVAIIGAGVALGPKAMKALRSLDLEGEVRAIAGRWEWAVVTRNGTNGRTISRWTRGRETVLGDAAHPMLPYLGQGVVLASRERGVSNHLASPLAALRRDVSIAVRRRLGRDPDGRRAGWIPEYDASSPEVLSV